MGLELQSALFVEATSPQKRPQPGGEASRNVAPAEGDLE
jgi:hypothetical protein